jgi:hypothetical protein
MPPPAAITAAYVISVVAQFGKSPSLVFDWTL